MMGFSPELSKLKCRRCGKTFNGNVNAVQVCRYCYSDVREICTRLMKLQELNTPRKEAYRDIELKFISSGKVLVDHSVNDAAKITIETFLKLDDVKVDSNFEEERLLKEVDNLLYR